MAEQINCSDFYSVMFRKHCSNPLPTSGTAFLNNILGGLNQIAVDSLGFIEFMNIIYRPLYLKTTFRKINTAFVPSIWNKEGWSDRRLEKTA
jgi:hypothetical protein